MGSRIVRLAILAAVIAAPVGPVLPAVASAECTPSVQISDSVGAKEGEQLKFTVTMTVPRGCDLVGSVQYETMGTVPNGVGYATPGVDYGQESGLLVWPSELPKATRTITVPALPDLPNETPEKVVVRLFGATDVLIGDDLGMGTIFSTPICSPTARTTAACTINLDLSAPARSAVSVTYFTIDGTARAGEDFVGILQGHLTIPIGASHAEFAVQILPNSAGEPEEQFEIQVTATSTEPAESVRFAVTVPREG